MGALFIGISIGAVAIAFYLRFIVALWGEYQVNRICYLIRLHPEEVESISVELEHEVEVYERAA